MKTQILYIPGLGDGYDHFRAVALKTWVLHGVVATHVPIKWYDKGSMESKLLRIRQAIDGVPTDRKIVLIGESAGAALALHAAERYRRVSCVITLCGVASARTPIASSLRRRAPALHQAVQSLPAEVSCDLHSVRATVDHVVNKQYSVAPGAKLHVWWTFGHIATITLGLTLLAPLLAAIAKQSKT
jgi:pimeloyl-ACP methyl ester carboxylesterase